MGGLVEINSTEILNGMQGRRDCRQSGKKKIGERENGSTSSMGFHTHHVKLITGIC